MTHVPRLRVGVIGAGSWAVAAHLPALQRRDDVDLVAVCRRGDDALQRIKDRFGFGVASEDYRDVLGAGVDAVVVAGPSALHHEHASAALRAGAHVLCEKPFTLTAADAWELTDIAAQQDRHLLVSFGWNFAPMIERTADLLAAAGIGRVEHLAITMSSQTRELLTDTGAYPDASPDTVPEAATWTDPALSGGGYGQAQLSHALALALGLTGARVAAAFALMDPAPGSRVELHDTFSLRLTDGGIASVAGGSAWVGADANKHHLAFEAIGDEGQLHVDVFRERVARYRPDLGNVELDVRPGEGAYDSGRAVDRLVDLALGLTRRNPAPGELGARTVEALELAYRSSVTGRLETADRGSA